MVMAMKRALGSGYRWLDVGMQMFRGLFTSAHSYMIFFVTARCNARCEFCFYWEEIESAASRRELKLEEIDKITQKLKHLLYLSIGGGEPFLRKDLADIVSLFYRNCKTRIVNITTNGLQPARTEALVERMLEENPNLFLKVGISLDALGDKHDEMRKVPGTFANVRETHAAVTQRIAAPWMPRWSNTSGPSTISKPSTGRKVRCSASYTMSCG